MLADQAMTIGAYATAFLGAVLLLLLALHAYAWWTIRDIDGNAE